MDSNHSFERQLWQKVSLLTLALLGLWAVILYPYAASGKTMLYVSSILAGTSGILLAGSFSLSSFSYYFDFLDSELIYRKYLGLMGYFFALFYALLTAYGNPVLYLYAFPYNLFEPTIGFGMVAMTILTFMALISNKKAIQILGGKAWKTCLGLGYIAYALLVIRAILLDGALWGAWLGDMTAPFTVRMFLTVLGTLVLCFRVSVPFHQKYFTTK